MPLLATKVTSSKILHKISLEFNKHSSALVGESRREKSTIFQLLMRFYDPDKGKIALNGVDFHDLSLAWLRENIVYIGSRTYTFRYFDQREPFFWKVGCN